MTTKKTDLGIAEHYVRSLAPERLWHLFHLIKEEFEITLEEIRALTGENELLDSNPTLKRTLEVRDQYLNPDQLHAGDLSYQDPATRRRRGGRGPEVALLTTDQRHFRRHEEHRLILIVVACAPDSRPDRHVRGTVICAGHSDSNRSRIRVNLGHPECSELRHSEAVPNSDLPPHRNRIANFYTVDYPTYADLDSNPR